MANAKNTIQNIPLTGNLNLNKLKTDVASFEGYNDKNTTVFGGELTNIYTKETKLGNKDNTYTIFNSKGEPFTIKEIVDSPRPYQSHIGLVNNQNTEISDIINNLHIKKLDIADKTYWASQFFIKDDIIVQIYLKDIRRPNVIYDGCEIYGRIGTIDNIDSHNWKRLGILNLYTRFGEDTRALFDLDFTVSNQLGWITIAAVSFNNFDKLIWDTFSIYNFNINSDEIDTTNTYKTSTHSTLTNINSTAFVNVAHGSANDKMYIFIVPFSGKKIPNQDDTVLQITLSGNPITEDVITTNYFYSRHSSISDSNIQNLSNAQFINNIDVSHRPHGRVNGGNSTNPNNTILKTVEVTPYASNCIFQVSDYPDNALTMGNLWVGHDGNYFLPNIKQGSYGYYIDGILFAISMNGRLIEAPGDIDNSMYYMGPNIVVYKKNQTGEYYVYTNKFLSTQESLSNILSNINKYIIDNRYIKLSSTKYFDIETQQILNVDLSYIPIEIPVWENYSSETSGLITASGSNVNYPISNIPFTSILMNPIVWTNVALSYHYNRSYYYRTIDFYSSYGDTAQSAKYVGSNVKYINTIYPIDTNGNIIYPITWNSDIIKGYSNNSLVQNGNSSYPLIYWSPNQNIYAYYALSAMSNIKSAFALQGQQYTFDDANIYNVQFANGIIQSSNSVCYIENMEFLGTLPTSAIFYSNYNKTFYKFTGDNILSKMFEANDIDEIRMVGQNPSTQSLWISTDKGIYVLSDTDMFKLNYIPENIYFNNEKTILVSKGETNWIEDDISLYDIENGGNPNKIKFKTKYYGLGGEHKAIYDCWYIRLHSDERVSGTITVKMNTITDSSFASNEETRSIEKSMYDENNQIYLKFQPKYQSGVAVQLELESDIPIYQISLGANVTDQVTQQAKFNF